MDKIGSSYIALPDLLIVGVAIVLYWCLTTLPPNSLINRVLALFCGFVIVSIVMVIPLADNLTRNGIEVLSSVGIVLALAVRQWNNARTNQTSVL